MRHIFISRSGSLLPDWAKAFPKAELYQQVEQLIFDAEAPTLVWLHNGYERKIWLNQAIKALRTQQPTVKMVVIADVPEQTDAFAALSSGVVGYCHAYSSAKVLKEVATVIEHGGIWLGQEFLQKMIIATAKLVSSPSHDVEHALGLLTRRERDVALQAAKGLSNKEIARVLNITERTVKAHLSAAFERLQVKDRLQLALILNERVSQLALSL